MLLPVYHNDSKLINLSLVPQSPLHFEDRILTGVKFIAKKCWLENGIVAMNSVERWVKIGTAHVSSLASKWIRYSRRQDL